MIDLMNIKDPSFIKKLSIKELTELAAQIREFLIENISKTGGHLSSNLGVVEITIAMYYVFDPEKDKFLFDVGHQSYVHKILTGRAKDFTTLRQYGGMSGYINRSESKYDVWESGHSSTTISAASGIIASGFSDRVITVIGDSSIMNGVAFEGLNFLGTVKGKSPIIILNDNKMGISKSVGALSKTFLRLRRSKFYYGLKKVLSIITPKFLMKANHQFKRSIKGLVQQDNIFEDMGFDYYGPYDGNDLKACIKLMQRLKNSKEPIVLHLLTKKGKGYLPSENDQSGSYHGVSPFDVKTGLPLKIDKSISYSYLVSSYLTNKRENENFFVVTPAMKNGSKLENFATKYPNSFYDVGIAEEHAADMAAGIALAGKKVVLLMYSTFAQRAYDQILNDISRQNLPVIIGIDRAGVVGEDGATHQGVYDISMFEAMPNIKICYGRNPNEIIGLFNYAFMHNDSPIVIRYPRASFDNNYKIDYNYQTQLFWENIQKGNKLNVISYGLDVERIAKLKDDRLNIIDAKCIKPMDLNMLKNVFENGMPIFIVEQTVASGTLYHKILDYKEQNGYTNKIYHHSFEVNDIIPHGKIDVILDEYGFSQQKLLDKINEIIK